MGDYKTHLIQSILLHALTVEDINLMLDQLDQVDWDGLLEARAQERDERKRKRLVALHTEELEALQKVVPISIQSTEADRILHQVMQQDLEKYHRGAVKYLQEGGDIARTIDTSEEG